MPSKTKQSAREPAGVFHSIADGDTVIIQGMPRMGKVNNRAFSATVDAKRKKNGTYNRRDMRAKD